MKTPKLLSLAVLSIAASASVGAVVIFDNGEVSSTSPGFAVNTNTNQRLFENFTIATSAEITDIFWQQMDNIALTPASTVVTIYNSEPEAAPAIFADTILSSRSIDTKLGTRATSGFGTFRGYQHHISGLSLALKSGTYWLGLNSANSGDPDDWVSGWPSPIENTTDTILGSWVANSVGSQAINGNFPFRLEGNLNVPDSGTSLTLLGAALAALGCFRKRFGSGSSPRA